MALLPENQLSVWLFIFWIGDYAPLERAGGELCFHKDKTRHYIVPITYWDLGYLFFHYFRNSRTLKLFSKPT